MRPRVVRLKEIVKLLRFEGLTGKFLASLSEQTNSKSLFDPVNYFLYVLYHVGIHDIQIFLKRVSQNVYIIYTAVTKFGVSNYVY